MRSLSAGERPYRQCLTLTSKKRPRKELSFGAPCDGAKPFECMDDIDVKLSDKNWAIVDALEPSPAVAE